MNRLRRRVAWYLAILVAALLVTTLGYQWTMATFEGRPQTFLDALQFAVEMFTTTGFGGDAPWETAEMHAFIIVTDLLGMALLVGALPVVATPLIQTLFAQSVPRSVDDDLTDHVVICSYTARSAVLSEELDTSDVPYVIVESDRERSEELAAAGHRVIQADPQSTAGLDAARLGSARALIADSSDQVDASIVLAARELDESVPVLSIVEDPDRARYHRLAGADHVLSPRPLLGESLAAKVTTALRTELTEVVEISDQLQLAEVSIRHGSRLAGSTLADSEIKERSGVTVIGGWFRGEFEAAPSPSVQLAGGTVLLVSGRPEQLTRLVELAQSSVRQFSAGETIIVGYGQVGRAVDDALEEAGLSSTVVDQQALDGVDVVGDATDPTTLLEADIEHADTVVLALPDDTTTEFATLVGRDLAPAAEIVARVDETANRSKTYRAGADYVLSLSTVTGRMAASHLLADREVLAIDQQMGVIRTTAPGLVGRSIAAADIRGETGTTVLAIEREGSVISDIGPDTRITQGDELVIVGTDRGIRAFETRFC